MIDQKNPTFKGGQFFSVFSLGMTHWSYLSENTQLGTLYKGPVTTWQDGAIIVLTHVVILLVDAVGPRVFALALLPLVVDPVEWVEVPLDGVPSGAPHLVDEVDHPDEEEEEDTGQDGKSNHHIEQGVAWKCFCGKNCVFVTILGSCQQLT